MEFEKIYCIADNSSYNACKTLESITEKYSAIIDEHNYDLVVVLGGDGFMLHSMHKYMHTGVPLYGINCGNIGFLMNRWSNKDLLENISKSKLTKLSTLSTTVHSVDGSVHNVFAINELSLFRQIYQTANICITVNHRVKIDKLVSDGVLLATPAGSGAYNSSVGGPILPICSNLLSLMPISPFRPRGWKGALLPDDVTVKFDVVHPAKRPVSAVADFAEFRNVCRVEVKKSTENAISLLFSPEQMLEDRIINEQFSLSCTLN
ncbi:NAD kinase [Rickettsiales bacterium]|nr:NAD kinase [Rickettsiales bacterium]